MENQDDTIRLKPRRIYKCPTCNNGKMVWERKQVIKDGENFRCPTCGQIVKDITNTQTGQDLMELVLL